MTTYRRYDSQKWPSYCEPIERTGINKSKKKASQKYEGKTKVRPYLPKTLSENKLNSPGSTNTFLTDDASFTTTRSGGNSISSSGRSDIFDSRRSISFKAKVALGYDSYGYGGSISLGKMEYEPSPQSPLFASSPDFLMKSRSQEVRKNSQFKSSDQEGYFYKKKDSFIQRTVKPLTNFIADVREANEKQREENREMMRNLAYKFLKEEKSETRVVQRKAKIVTFGENFNALFFPLDIAFEDWNDNLDSNLETIYSTNGSSSDVADVKSISDSESDSESEDELKVLVEVCFETDEDIKEYPRILSQSVMQQIAENGLPIGISLRKWKRLYNLGRDGDSLSTFLYMVENYRFTLMAIKTTKGEVFGAYAHDKWESKKGSQKGFYGSGQTFLFSVTKKKQGLVEINEDRDTSSEGLSNPESHVNIYKWKGCNSFFQLCDLSKDRIALGGGSDSFGLCVEDSFRYGSTGYCSTFGNDPLCSDEEFDVLDVEVYGFVTAGYHDN